MLKDGLCFEVFQQYSVPTMAPLVIADTQNKQKIKYSKKILPEL